MHTIGGILLVMWILRFFVFNLYESPKYLMGRGRDEEAIAVVKRVAAYNGREHVVEKLTAEDLKRAGTLASGGVEEGKGTEHAEMDTSALGAVRRKVRSVFGAGHLKALFATKKLAWNTSLLIFLWGKHFRGDFVINGLTFAALGRFNRFGVPTVSWL